MRNLRDYPVTHEERMTVLDRLMHEALRSTSIGDIAPAAIASIRAMMIAKGKLSLDEMIEKAVTAYIDQALKRFKDYETQSKLPGGPAAYREAQQAVQADMKIIAALRKQLGRY